MLHWHPEPHTVFPEWKRVLRVDGLLLFSCFGPDTLKELRLACRTALPSARPMPFIDMHDFGDMMVASGFANPVMDAEVLTLTYPSPRDLLREVRALGGNPRDDRVHGAAARPTGKVSAGCPGRPARGRWADSVNVRSGLRSCVEAGDAFGDGASVSVDSLRADLARRRQTRQGA